MPRPRNNSRIVTVRVNNRTAAELVRRARIHKQPIGTYLRNLLQEIAPGDTAKVRSRKITS